jgi:hypothetical protein
VRITVGFLGLLALIGWAQGCDTSATESVFCAEKFCEPGL